MLKICVTGSDGFIGAHLLELLRADKTIEVVAFVGDLLSEEDVSNFFDENPGISQIIHLVGLFDGSFDDLVRVNAVALKNLTEQAIKSGVRKIIYTSTGAVYGEPIGEESFENDPRLPNTLYGLSKLYGEECLEYYTRHKLIDSVILRFPNVYGPGSKKGVVSNFLNGIKGQRKISVEGDGSSTRNFLHVADACRAIRLAVNYDKSGSFNISNPDKISVNQLVEIFRKKYKFEVEYRPSHNNLRDLLLNGDKARENLGFAPEIKKLLIPE